MVLTSSLRKEHVQLQSFHMETEGQYLQEQMNAASQVISPLWPIATFAARNPWMGLEKQTFEEVANWLNTTRHVDIYPSASVIISAKKKGEIDEVFAKKGMERWLASHSFHIPREKMEQYAQAALKLNPLPSHLLESTELIAFTEQFSVQNDKSATYQALQPKSLFYENKNGNNLLAILDGQIIKWCKLFMDNSQAGWEMPHREKGFYRAWHHLVVHDTMLTKAQRETLKDFPKNPQEALLKALRALEIPKDKYQAYLEGHFLTLPGWAGMMLWRSEQSKQDSELLTEYMAIRISMEACLITTNEFVPVVSKKATSLLKPIAAWIQWGNVSLEEFQCLSADEQHAYISFAQQFDERLCRKIWLEAWEQTYEERLRAKIKIKHPKTNDKKKPLAQLAFCIDVRSEPFRRQLEKEEGIETIGIAGFFGLQIATNTLGCNSSHPALPVILKPQQKIKEIAEDRELKSYIQRKNSIDAVNYTFKRMKQNVVASLLLPELSGPLLSLQMMARSFMPKKTGRLKRFFGETWLRKPSTELTLHRNCDISGEIPIGFTEEEKVSYARQALEMMGLTKDFADLVVICGHGSHSTNNPYASALDCGACGGAAGGFNAKVLATLLNLREVRQRLAFEGVTIPTHTIFTAAEHNTTTDELHWLFIPTLSEEAKRAYEYMESILPKVRQNASQKRLEKLPQAKLNLSNNPSNTFEISEDWSEVRPEWGLARNAAFIIGKRELTQEVDLEGRAFLHNYDWEKDENGSLLANIVAGPGTVTQWINLQYYASTVAPHYYGSGKKATQTVTAGLGVMQGNGSDLLAGLPWESVMQSDDNAYHSPLRLLVLIQAPKNYITRLLANDVSLQEKVKNGWLRLASIDTEGRWENW